ncbi:hypothetical protein [Novipirellula artificiosorum]|uniref:Glycoamylase-like domain-containing protein n=1 Tax=Novipirellula artificiosorum TaxID=2528016 RepID=A0A5C6D8M8_9BACT|nr:hypothetical protein [Novipirellula artificiosorum]TWU32475.1 hypothetical protein Poly41_54530 [Novipirellula artificiosorum]
MPNWSDHVRVLQKLVGGIWIVLALDVACAQALRVNATGHDSRIDIEWESDGLPGNLFDIYRSEKPDGAFEKINETPHRVNVYSDFLGQNPVQRFYRVVPAGDSMVRAPIVSARTRPMSDDELLESVQEATFRYFWNFGHPVSGLARERNTSGDTCTIGGSGFGLMAIVVGAERGFVTRAQSAERILKTVRFLEDKTPRYHGAWAHWVNGRTGATIPFARKNGIHADDGGDLVETSFLVQGLLTVRQYFDRVYD